MSLLRIRRDWQRVLLDTIQKSADINHGKKQVYTINGRIERDYRSNVNCDIHIIGSFKMELIIAASHLSYTRDPVCLFLVML